MLSLAVEKKTWMHALSVPFKLVLLCGLTLALLPVFNWQVASLAMGVVAVLYLSAGWAFARIGIDRLKPLGMLLAIIFIYHVVTGRSLEGLVICLKLFATVGFANLVTMTSRLDDMMAVIETLSAPLRHFGLPPRALGFAMGLVVRFTPVFLKKGEILNEAWRARSPKKTSPRLLVPLALGALDDADRVADALRARGGLTYDTSAKDTASKETPQDT